MAQIAGLGHVGIYATDLIKMRDFYTRVLGLEIADQDLEELRMVFLGSDPVREHHDLLLMEGRVTADDAKVIQQISFRVPSIQDLRDFKARIDAENLTIDRIVSHGNAFGIYFFDPEGNRVKLYYKTGFPVSQPHVDPLDLSRTDAELLADARALLHSKR